MRKLPNEMLESLFENAFQLMSVLDAEGKVLATNRAALNVIGRREDEVVGLPFWETPWWEGDQEGQARIQAAVARAMVGNFVRLECHHGNPSGQSRVVDLSLTPCRDDSGRVRWIFPEGRDISEQKQAEGALKESEEKFRQIYQRSYDGILLLDGDCFVDCNPAVLAMMRCSHPELMRMHPWELSPPTQPDGRPSPEKALEMIALAHAKGGHRFEWVHRRTDGEDFPVEVTLTPFPFGGREILYTTWRDITERKREERERLELARQVLHSQKLESLGILAGGIAHDFNNLMAAMTGYIELATLETPSDSRVREHLKSMLEILDRATSLTRQMLAYSGRGRFVVGPVDLSRLAREMSRLLVASLPKKVSFDLDLPMGLPVIEGDSAQLQQVLLNLVTNASDAIGDEPGRIRISMGTETLDAAAIATLHAEATCRPGVFVFLEVSDSGCGISPEIQSHIFEPFFSTKDTGRGLGLAALTGILRSHHGALQLRSTLGKGTTFRLYFPSAGRYEEAPAEISKLPPALPAGLRVLLVEDEDSLREATRQLLEGMGCEVVAACDGLEALAKLASDPPMDIVLLDLMMPLLDGRQTLHALEQEHPELPVVLCSGYSQQEIQSAGNCQFLAKPYTIRSLQEALLKALARG